MSGARPPTREPVVVRLYHLALKVLPADFRHEAESEMLRTFEDEAYETSPL